MNVIKLIIGIIFIFGSIGYFLYRKLCKPDEIGNKDYMLLANQIKIYFGVIIFLILGIVMVYRELEMYF